MFCKLCPRNNDFSSVLLKVSVLNTFAGTQIYDIIPVAKHIYEKKIDQDLKSGKGDLVNKIALTKVPGRKTRNNYSFASKYYAFHKPRVYSIYDRYVDQMLWHFRKNLQNIMPSTSQGFIQYMIVTLIRCFGILEKKITLQNLSGLN